MSALYGLSAEFPSGEALVEAARQAHARGYRRMDGYTPYPVEGLAEALGMEGDGGVALVSLAGGLMGGAGAFMMQWWANMVSYPINIGGRPLDSWPSFVPITFELTVLSAGLSAGLIGLLAMNRLPLLHHPIFNSPRFEHASQDTFFLCIEASDPLFERVPTEEFLRAIGSTVVYEVPYEED